MGITIFSNQDVEINRDGKFLLARLRKPHRTLSTCFVNGGMSESLTHIVNHQSGEGKSHDGHYQAIIDMGQESYHTALCGALRLPPDAVALLSTAANMQYAMTAAEVYQEIEVTAVATAGVQGNAGRAGDPAGWHESPGTINILLFINWPLTPPALTKAAVTLTEAKTAALAELSVASRYSQGLATGTGTDQFAIAAVLDSTRKPKAWSNHHAKLGELIAKTVIRSVKEALKWQNGLTPSHTRSIVYALERFGFKEEVLRENFKKILLPSENDFFLNNYNAIIFDPQAAGSAYGLASIIDRIAYGTLPGTALGELLVNQCTLLACGLAADPALFQGFRERLLPHKDDLIQAVSHALILGWRAKWRPVS